MQMYFPVVDPDLQVRGGGGGGGWVHPATLIDQEFFFPLWHLPTFLHSQKRNAELQVTIDITG